MNDFKKSIILLFVKVLLIIVVPCYFVGYLLIHLNTTNGFINSNLFTSEVFNNSISYSDELFFFDKKFFICEKSNSICLDSAEMILINRFIQSDSYSFDLDESDYGYSVIFLENDSNEFSLIVYGKNYHASSITINFLDEEYTEILSHDSLFIKSFPIYKKIPNEINSKNLFSTFPSKELKVTFRTDDGLRCNHIKFISP